MKLFQQDDCAPDSFESFSEEFKASVGMTVSEFKKVAFQANFPDGIQWSHKGYMLEWWCDDPFYLLYDLRRPLFKRPAEVIQLFAENK